MTETSTITDKAPEMRNAFGCASQVPAGATLQSLQNQGVLTNGRHVVFTDKGDRGEARYFIQPAGQPPQYIDPPRGTEGRTPVARPAPFVNQEQVERLNTAIAYENSISAVNEITRPETGSTAPGGP